jgi:hypothetical protein
MSFLQISHAEDLENLIDVDSVQQTHKINLLENLLCCLIWWQKKQKQISYTNFLCTHSGENSSVKYR